MRIILLFGLFLTSFIGIGQRYSFVQFSTPEGLPQSQVNSITQDEKGYLWIGTFGGLSKFNGRNFENYGTKNGLLNNRVTKVYTDSSYIIIGHENGISYSSYGTNFENIPLNIQATVSDILQLGNDYLIATNGAGLFRFNTLHHTIEAIPGSPERIRGLAQFKSAIYLATRDGVYTYSIKSNLFQKSDYFPEDSYSDIKAFEESLIAVVFDGVCYQLKNKQVHKIVESEKHRFRSICPTGNGIWLNSSQGVLLLEDDNIIELTETSGLPINNISTVFQDREGNIWLGSAGKGLLKFSGKAFTHFNKQSGIPSELITSILEDPEGHLWLSTFDKGVIKMENNGDFIPFNYPDVTLWSSIIHNHITYFGSNYGLHAFKNGKWSSYYSEDGLPANRITGLHSDASGRLFIGTSGGLAIMDTDSIHIVHGTSGIDVLNVRNFCEFKNATYLATQKGLKVFRNGSIELVEQFEYPINSILTSSNDQLWIGTENGLFSFHDGKVREIDLGDAPGSRYINFLVTDGRIIYAGTNNGLLEIDVEHETLQKYGINSGLIDLETNLNSGYLSQHGILWFGTASGLMRFDTKIKSEGYTNIEPRLHFKSFLLNFELDASLFSQLMDGKTIQLSPGQSNLFFEFDALFLTNPSNIYFTYLLQGASDEWSPQSTNNTLNFNNLPAGKYTLQVRAEVMNGLQSNEVKLHFEILPPFYKSWWFFLIFIFLGIMGLYFIDRNRIRRMKQLNYQTNLEITTKLSRLEQQSLNASMNRHFIFNALNSIQYFINASDKQSANRYLTRFAKLIRKNLDSSHMENGMVPLLDELERLELYLQLEEMRFRDRFDYHIYIDPLVETETLKVPAMFLQPFVENSIIHGILPLENKKGIIEIRVTNHMDHIRIEIFDNGIGIDNSLKQKAYTTGDHKSHGMRITLGRIQLLQEISERSVELIGPHQINENDTSVKGTVVTFKFLKQYLEN